MSKKLAIIALLAITFVISKAQVTVQPIPDPHMSFVNAVGLACAGCKLQTFAAGTTTPQATYTDSTGTAQNANPIILDLTGSANIWGIQSAYKFVLQDPFGNTLFTLDNIPVICTTTSCNVSTLLPGCSFTSGGNLTCSTVKGNSINAGTSIASGVLQAIGGAAPGSFSFSGTSGCANLGFVNGADLTTFNGADSPVQGAVCGSLQTGTTEGNNIIEAPAVIGLADNLTNAPGAAGGTGGTDAVGGYFQGRTDTAGTSTVFPVAEGINVAGIANASNSNITGEEIDMDISPSVTGVSLVGLSIAAPNISVAPRFSAGIIINAPAGAAATPWGSGITVQQGATAIGLQLDAQNTSGTSASQSIVFVGENSGTATSATIGADSAGDVVITPNSSSMSLNIFGNAVVSGNITSSGNGNFANVETGNVTGTAFIGSTGNNVHLVPGTGASIAFDLANAANTLNVMTVDNSGNATLTGGISAASFNGATFTAASTMPSTCTVGELWTNPAATSASTVLAVCFPANTFTFVTVP